MAGGQARRAQPGGATLYRLPLSARGRDALVNVGIAPFRTPEGTTAGTILVLEDVTDRANLEEQLRLSEKMAAIGLLAAGVAQVFGLALQQARALRAAFTDTAHGPLCVQELYGQHRLYLGPAHGFAGHMLAFMRGWEAIFRSGRVEHSLKELCRVYVSKSIACEY